MSTECPQLPLCCPGQAPPVWAPGGCSVPTCKGALQPLAPAGQVAAGAEEAAGSGGDHSHEEDHGCGQARRDLGTGHREWVLSPEALTVGTALTPSLGSQSSSQAEAHGDVVPSPRVVYEGPLGRSLELLAPASHQERTGQTARWWAAHLLVTAPSATRPAVGTDRPQAPSTGPNWGGGGGGREARPQVAPGRRDRCWRPPTWSPGSASAGTQRCAGLCPGSSSDGGRSHSRRWRAGS